MARSKWKLNYFSKSLVRKLFLFKIFKIKAKKLFFTRSSAIPEFIVGETFFIHSGLRFNKLTIKTLMIGHKFGEFSFTRKPFFFPKKEIKKTKFLRR